MTDVVVARIGRPHGLRGEVTVRLHTDVAQQRFVVGARFATEPAERGPLTLRTARMHNGVQLLAFDQAADRSTAEELRGVNLLATAEDVVDDDAWYEDDLVDLEVRDVNGARLGTISALHSRPAQDLIVVRLQDGREVLVPFVEQIVPEVDLAGGHIVLTPPPGLLELD